MLPPRALLPELLREVPALLDPALVGHKLLPGPMGQPGRRQRKGELSGRLCLGLLGSTVELDALRFFRLQQNPLLLPRH